MADNDTSGVLRTEGVPTYLVAFEEVSEKNEEIVFGLNASSVQPVSHTAARTPAIHTGREGHREGIARP